MLSIVINKHAQCFIISIAALLAANKEVNASKPTVSN